MVYLRKRVEVMKKLDDNTWQDTDDATVLDDAYNVQTRMILGKGKDGFEFNISNKKNRIHETLFSGDGTTTQFTMPWAPPSEFLDTDHVRVFISDVEKTYTTDYTILGAVVTFTSAPASGNENIVVRYSLLKAGDRIRIYWWKDSGTYSDDDLEMEGSIEIPLVSTDGNNTYTVRGYTLFESLMNGMAFMTPDADVNKPHLAIIQVLASINKYYPDASRQIYGATLAEWEDVNNPFTGAGNPTTKQDGSAFPTEEFSFDYKRGVDCVEELSGHERTDDGQYIYMVLYQNDRYEFIWAPQSEELSGILSYGTGMEVIKAQKDVSEVANVIIYHCGSSPYGVPVRWFAIDSSSTLGAGARFRYITKQTCHLTGMLLNNEYLANPTSWENDGADPPNRKENFPKNSAYPYTLLFETRDAQGDYSGTDAVAADDDEFNELIVDEAMWLGYEIAMRILEVLKNPRIRVTLTYSRDTTTYSLGQLWTINLKPFGLYEVPLRLNQINHDFWKTTLFLQEDEDTATLP